MTVGTTGAVTAPPTALYGGRVDLDAPVFSDPTAIDNPLFPIAELTQVVQLGEEAGEALRTEATLLADSKTIEYEGRQVETLVQQYVAYLADGRALLVTEQGTERKAGVWMVAGDPLPQPPLDDLGPEADTVTAEQMAARFAAHSMRVHTFLRDQRILAGLGRRLANEVCWTARLSPFAQTRGLGAVAVQRIEHRGDVYRPR